MKYIVTINDKRYEVEVEKGKATIVNTSEIAVGSMQQVEQTQAQMPAPAAAPEKQPVPAEAPKAAPVSSMAGEAVKSPMTGGILDIKVSVGTKVKKGDILLILEAMKMENEITSPCDGVVSQILVAKGGSVATNDVLLIIQ